MTNGRRQHKKIGRTLGFLIVASVLLVLSFSVAFAKYTTGKKAKMVANANGFYFSSNYLNEVKAGQDSSEYIMYGWDGKTKKSFAFNIRNYDNPLLYNGEDQDVSYDIKYEVQEGFEDKVDIKLYKLVDGVYVEQEFNGVLYGGDNFTDINYKLSIIPKEGSNITQDLSVQLTAKTVNSPYKRTLTTKVTLQYTEYQNFISKKEFVNVEAGDYAFVYSICTANAADLEEMENSYVKSATRRIHVSWNTNYVTLDRFDNQVYDTFAKKIIGKGGVTEDNMKQETNVIFLNEETGEAHIFFDALPFSAFEMYLYKKKGLSNAVWDGLTETDIIKAEVVRD